jgi:glycosyltransferase involved in cell wall biosynthesis
VRRPSSGDEKGAGQIGLPPNPRGYQPEVSVVIPVRPTDNPAPTIDSLMRDEFKDLELIVIVDQDLRGAPWARNRGAEIARGRYLLFSDGDVIWEPGAVTAMLWTLKHAIEDWQHAADASDLEPAYAYGMYAMDGAIYCRHDWDGEALRKGNYISTMSLVRLDVFREWDEDVPRLNDWALWLDLMFRGYRGVWVPRVLFTTKRRKGITFDGPVSYEEAERLVKRKFGLAGGHHAARAT